MAKAKKKAAKPKSAARKSAAPSKAPKPARKKASAKRKATLAPAKKATAPMVAEHPEGMFTRLNALREEMDNLFSSMTRSFGFPDIKVPTIEWPSRPSLVDVRFQVSETDKAIEVKAEMPGLTEDDIEIELADEMLTIKGEKRDDQEEKEKDYYVHERRYGSFSRSFRVPDSVIEEDITADLEKGVLCIRLPKRTVAKRGKKSVKVSKKP